MKLYHHSTVDDLDIKVFEQENNGSTWYNLRVSRETSGELIYRCLYASLGEVGADLTAYLQEGTA
jgi:hypothetical protein